jgi:hypothetical protein
LEEQVVEEVEVGKHQLLDQLLMEEVQEAVVVLMLVLQAQQTQVVVEVQVCHPIQVVIMQKVVMVVQE